MPRVGVPKADELPSDATALFPLMMKTQTPFERFKPKGYLSVTDLVGKYCELMSYYEMWTGVRREQTASMRAGTDVHRELELMAQRDIPGELVEAYSQLVPVAESNEEQWALKMFDIVAKAVALANGASARELYVVGELHGTIVTGYIDEVRLDGATMTVVDTKSRATLRLPPQSQINSAYHQVLIYQRLLAMLLDGTTSLEVCLERLGLDMDSPFSGAFVDVLRGTAHNLSSLGLGDVLTLRSLARSAQCAVSRLPHALADATVVEYISSAPTRSAEHIGKVEFDRDDATLDEVLQFAFDMWHGRRYPLGVDAADINRCVRCQFKYRCQWRKLAQEYASTHH